MYGCESWTVKKAECWRIDAFELWYWRRDLRVPWTAWQSNQFILKEISPEYSLEGLMSKLKLQYSGHLMRRMDSFEKTLMPVNIECEKRKGWQRMRWMDGITDATTPGVGDGQRGLVCCSPWVCKKLDMTEWLNQLTNCPLIDKYKRLFMEVSCWERLTVGEAWSCCDGRGHAK